MRDDAGYLQAMEAVIVATVLLGAVLWLSSLPGNGSQHVRDAAMDTMAADMLQVLANLPAAAPYESALHEWTTDALRGDVAPLARWIDRTLPVGTGWGFYLDNGHALETVHETGTPTGVVRTADVLFDPGWSYALAFASLDRQPGTTGVPMQVEVVPVRNSYLDRTAAASVVFANGRSFALTARGDGILTAAAVPPEDVDAPAGFDVPYDISSSSSYASSLAVAASGSAARYNVTTTLPYGTIDRAESVYRVHPSHVADPAIQSYLDSEPRVRPTNGGKARPGEAASVTFDYGGLPVANGWVVAAREIRVYGPLFGEEVASASLPALSGTWSWDVPASALYGTYVVDVRLTLVGDGVLQTVHDITAFDVLRKGVDAPVPPVYRAVLAVWFEAVG